MGRLRIAVPVAAALAATALFAGGTVASASATARPHVQAQVRPDNFQGQGLGDGPTAAAARLDAKENLVGTFSGCIQPFVLLYDTEDSDGIWWAEMVATCSGYN
jgi:hypothetical protein